MFGQYARYVVGAAIAFSLVLTSSVAEAGRNEVILIGAPMSFTGQHATNGKHSRKGYQLAVNLINENGGIEVDGKKYDLKVKYYDDESNPKLAAKFAKRLITRDDVQFMLGPYSTAITDAVADVTEKYRMPMVQANGAALSLFEKDRIYMFAVLSGADQYLTEALDLLAERTTAAGGDTSSLKVAIAVENDPFSGDLRQGVVNAADKFDMKVIIDEFLPRDFKDMTFILDKVKEQAPDILVVSGHEGGAELAIRQIKEQKIDVPMLAMTHCEGADIHGMYGVYADYTVCATQWSSDMPFNGTWFGNPHNYKKRFEAEYGYEPPYQSAESSEAVLVLADAIQRANSLDREKVRAALTKTDMETFFGWIRFDETGKNVAKPIVLRQLVKGRYLVVAPSGYAKHEVVYPRPKWSER
ncbi:MAG: amino acid ABC transporter substrate-binding protein [Alphaproteobacteria bacterium]|nr:amino acid ABC transporter substrate-binding protein [Alphaproteobacteria bacterium]